MKKAQNIRGRAKRQRAASNMPSPVILVTAILLLTAIVFYPSLHNGFTNWDDNQYVTQNEMIKDLSWHGVTAFFTTFYGGNYHPLVALTNAIEYNFWELNATPYHVINLCLHILNTGLVFYFILLLTRRREAALIVALFFGIHPMHVESVAWIAERKDVLYTAFYLGSLIFYLRYLHDDFRKKYLALSFALLACSLLSKSAAVVAPLAMLLIDVYRKREWTMKAFVEKIPFFLLSLGFGIVALFSQSSAKAMNTLAPFSLIDRVGITSYSILFYIYKLFVPFNFSAFYNFPLLGVPMPVKFYIAPVILLAIIFFIGRAKTFRRELIFGFGFYLLNVVLVVQIVSIGMTIVSERYAYVSYIGLFFILGQFYCETEDGRWKVSSLLKPILRIALVTFAIVCLVQTWNRTQVWKDGITLFTDALEKEKTSPIPYYNRAMAKYHTNDFPGAILDFNRAIALYDKEPEYFLNRGASRFAVSDYKGALEDFKRLLALDPNHAEGLVDYGNAQAMLGDYTHALESFNKAIALKPDEKMSYYNRGHLYLRLADTTHACIDWQRAVTLGYTDASISINRYCKH